MPSFCDFCGGLSACFWVLDVQSFVHEGYTSISSPGEPGVPTHDHLALPSDMGLSHGRASKWWGSLGFLNNSPKVGLFG